MPILAAAPLLIIAQAVASTPPVAVRVPPPRPTLAPAGTSPQHDQVRARREEELRRECYSEEGIKAILAREEKSARFDPRSNEQVRGLAAELHAAVVAEPLDIPRLEAAEAKYRAFWLDTYAKVAADNDRQRFELLRRLPPEDRSRYAKSTFGLGADLLPGHVRPSCHVDGQAQLPVAPPPIKIAPAPRK